MKKYIVSFIVFYSVIFQLGGQNIDITKDAEFIPKSPEIKGIQKYGEYPVSEYTGIPSINIPLYTIKLKNIEFPISLDYHASGIQVTQEATWVGLGWNLLAGGSISTIAVGVADGPNSTYAQPTDWSKILNYIPTSNTDGMPRIFNEEGLRKWGCDVGNDTYSTTRTPDMILSEAQTGSGERDIYSVNFLGYNFNVSIHPVTKQIIFNGEKNKFKIEKSGESSWTITDEKGYTYYFASTESYMSGSNKSQISTWYLTKIYYTGLPIPLLEINYSTSLVTQLPSMSETISSKVYPNVTPDITFEEVTRSFAYTTSYNQLYISSIISPLDSIVFSKKARIDLQNASALDQITVYDRSTKSEIKNYKFEHDYFTGIVTGAKETSLDYVKKRLRLNKIYERVNTQNAEIYQFTYNDIPLPYKTSFSQDLWGFYNGQENSTSVKIPQAASEEVLFDSYRTLLPEPVFLSLNQTIPSEFLNIRGANRAVNKSTLTAGMLKSITYPTGGKTEFEFESHILNNKAYPDAIRMNSVIFSENKTVINNGNSSFSTPTQTFEIDKETKAKIKIYIVGKDYNTIQMESFYLNLTVCAGSKSAKTTKYFIETNDQKIQFNNNKSVTIEADIILPVGRVIMSSAVLAGMPYQGYSLTNGVQATLTYSDIDYTSLKKAESVGGGIRIKRITNYLDDSTKSSTTDYTYVSGGKLLQPLCFAQSMTMKFPFGVPEYNGNNLIACSVGSLSSNNKYNYSVNGCGKSVGYSKVETKTNSVLNATNTGSIITEFINNATNSVQDYFFYPDVKQYTNGKISSRIILDAKGDTLNIERNSYSIDNLEYIYMNINVVDKYVGPTNQCETTVIQSTRTYNPYAHGKRFNIIVYPTSNYTVHLIKKDQTDFYGAKRINKTIDYEYDLLNYLPKKITETVGDKKKISEYKYTLNYGAGDFYCQSMLASLNIVSKPIEEFYYINTIPVQSKKTEYFKFGSLVEPSAILVKNSTGDYESRIEYENYDGFGNPQYVTKDDASKSVYLWGYNYQYPIAEIKNATFAQVAAIISVTNMDIIAKKQTPSEADFILINSLRTNQALGEAHVSTYKYKPAVGTTQITDSKGITTYYSYDVFNRLKESYIIENGVKKILESYDYYIKN